MTARPLLLPLALALAVLAISTSSVLIRFAQSEAPSLLIAAARLAFAALCFAPNALLRHRSRLAECTRRDLLLALAAGCCLALHFATWIVSLEHTSVVSSVVFVTTSPLWVALLSPLFLGERLGGRTALGIAVAVAGGVVIAVADAGAHAGGRPHALGGDLLALGGAFAMAGYLMIGRRLLARFELVPYLFMVYGIAAIVMIAWAFAAGTTLGRLATLSPSTWGWLVLLALFPQVLGHSTVNWALRTLPAAIVSIALLGEPLAAAAWAWWLFGERPGPITLAGAALVLAGMALAATSAPRARS